MATYTNAPAVSATINIQDSGSVNAAIYTVPANSYAIVQIQPNVSSNYYMGSSVGVLAPNAGAVSTWYLGPGSIIYRSGTASCQIIGE